MASLAAGKDAKKTDGATTISAEVKTSVLNEAKAMNNMDGEDSKGGALPPATKKKQTLPRVNIPVLIEPSPSLCSGKGAS